MQVKKFFESEPLFSLSESCFALREMDVFNRLSAAYEFICGLARSAEEKYPGLNCRVYKIINNFFGDTITVTGLLTGQDLAEQLLGKKLGGTLLLSECMVMRGSDIFLDDMTVPQLEQKLNVKIKLTPQDGAMLFDNIVGISDN